MSITTATAPITATFGTIEVKAYRLANRFLVDTSALFQDDSKDQQLLRAALDALVKSTGWDGNCGQSSLAGALMADWEPAHIFVAMNLKELEKYASGKTAYFRSAEDLLWSVMCLPRN